MFPAPMGTTTGNVLHGFNRARAYHVAIISAKAFLLSCVLPLPFLSYWTFHCLCRCHIAASPDSGGNDQQDCKSLQKVLFEPFRARRDDHPTVSWESVLIGRRFVLIAVHTVAPDPVSRLLSLSFLCVLFLLHHNTSQPFRDSKANAAETASLLGLVALATTNVFVAIFPTLGVVPGGPMSATLAFCTWLEVAILGLLPAILVLALLLILVSQIVRALLWAWTQAVRCYHDYKRHEARPLLDHASLQDTTEQE